MKDIINFFKIKRRPLKITFLKDDLNILDELQNKILGTQDGSQSVWYKTDMQIFELCLEMNSVLYLENLKNLRNLTPSKIEIKIEQFKNINRILGAYFTQNLYDRL